MKRKTVIFVLAAVVIITGIILGIYIFRRNSGETYTVIFYDDIGRVLGIETVQRRQAAAAPVEPEMEYGSIFQKWNKNFSSVKSDMEIYPEVTSINGKDNLFAMPGAYGRSGEYMVVPLRLCGKVNLSAFDLTVEYDTKCLTLDSVFNEDGGIIYNDQVPGQVRMNYVSLENTTSDVDICYFKFLIQGTQKETKLSISVNEVYVNDGEDIADAVFNVCNSKVYVY